MSGGCETLEWGGQRRLSIRAAIIRITSFLSLRPWKVGRNVWDQHRDMCAVTHYSRLGAV